MRHLLIINPNTSGAVSDLLQGHAQGAAGPDVRVRTVTARFGAPYIACEASYAVAGHATLDAWAAARTDGQPAPDAVLIGCFGDPGLLALRDTSRVPVTGLAEAAFVEAAAYGRFAIVTGGARWQPILGRLAQMLGYGDKLAGIQTVTPTGAQLAADPVAARALLAAACQTAVRNFQADAVILGGAGLARLVRRKPFSASWEYHLESALFTTPPVPQHSGAPLFNQRGELLGIGSLRLQNTATESRPLPGNLFVPIDLLSPILQEMRASGSSRLSRRLLCCRFLSCRSLGLSASRGKCYC